MPAYSVFGLTLLSDVPLPEAAMAQESAPDCRLTHRRESAPSEALQLIGDEKVYGDVRVRSFQGDAGYRLVFDDTGAFDISADGRRLTWWSADRGPDSAVQVDILGRVLAFALHCQGVLSLHASAVSIDGAGVAFLAPKHYGKSTLATALVRSGARLITDDTLAVETATPPRLRPGIQTLRLWDDTSALYRVGEKSDGSSKAHFRPEREHLVGCEPTNLQAIYLLHPEEPRPGLEAAVRRRCSAEEALLSIVKFRKLGALLGGAAGVPSFEAAVAVAQAVPTYRMQIARDLERLPDVVTAIRSWHGPS